MKLLVSLIGGTVLFRIPLPLATLCIIQVMFLIDNSVYAAEKEWPYKPMKKSPLPEVKNRDWANNGIDPFILSRLEDKKIEYRHAGRLRKLTDIGGNVLKKIIAWSHPYFNLSAYTSRA